MHHGFFPQNSGTGDGGAEVNLKDRSRNWQFRLLFHGSGDEIMCNVKKGTIDR